MSKRYTFTRPYKDAYEIVDRDIDKALNPEDVVDLLNQYQERIEELEEQLKNSVIPKFKVNDRIFVIVNNEVEEYYVDEVLLKVKGTLVAYRDICKETTITEKNELFATKEEALAKLKELKGE